LPVYNASSSRNQPRGTVPTGGMREARLSPTAELASNAS
jgi:hypothetical protein